MGVDLVIESGEGIAVSVQGGQTLQALDVMVPADVSSAAFFLVAAAASEGSELRLPGVGLNPTRTGVIDVLRRMGADIEIERLDDGGTEPVGDIRVRGGCLRGVTVEGAEIPRVIDEIPVLAVAASLASGETLVRDAGELRVKESDRIKSTVAMLRALGAEVEERNDGFLVAGRSGSPLPGGGEIESEGDHRIAMAGVVGAGLSSRSSVVRGVESMDVSFPGFARTMDSVRVP